MMHGGRKNYIIAVLLSNLSKKEAQKQKLLETMFKEDGKKGKIADFLSNPCMLLRNKTVQQNIENIEKDENNDVPSGMEMYLKTYTYVDARMYEENKEEVRKKIRFAMPWETQVKVSFFFTVRGDSLIIARAALMSAW